MDKMYTLEISVSVSDESAANQMLEWLKNTIGQAALLSFDNSESETRYPVAKYSLMTAKPVFAFSSIEKMYREGSEEYKDIFFYTAEYEITNCPEDAKAVDLMGLINLVIFHNCLLRTDMTYIRSDVEIMKRDISDKQKKTNLVISKLMGGVNRLGNEVFGEDMFYIPGATQPQSEEPETPEIKKWLH